MSPGIAGQWAYATVPKHGVRVCISSSIDRDGEQQMNTKLFACHLQTRFTGEKIEKNNDQRNAANVERQHKWKTKTQETKIYSQPMKGNKSCNLVFKTIKICINLLEFPVWVSGRLQYASATCILHFARNCCTPHLPFNHSILSFFCCSRLHRHGSTRFAQVLHGQYVCAMVVPRAKDRIYPARERQRVCGNLICMQNDGETRARGEKLN